MPLCATRRAGLGRRSTIAIGLLGAVVAIGGCGEAVAPGTDGAGIGSVTSASNSSVDSSNPEPGELSRLAEQASVDLADHARQSGRASPDDDPATWLVTLEVDLPLRDADLDDPVSALPEPFDHLGPSLISMVIQADSPDGPIGSQLQAPFTGLRAQLDGSNQVVTTMPGDEPPSTSTWPVLQPRIQRLRLTVADFDALAVGSDIIAMVGADQLELGPPGGWSSITVAEARAGVPATMPPSTGTRPLPSDPSTTTSAPPNASDTTDPDG